MFSIKKKNVRASFVFCVCVSGFAFCNTNKRKVTECSFKYFYLFVKFGK